MQERFDSSTDQVVASNSTRAWTTVPAKHIAMGAASVTALGSLSRAASLDTTEEEALLLLFNRIEYGFSLPRWEEAKQLGYDRYLHTQLNYERIADPEIKSALAPLTTLRMTSKQLFDNFTTQNMVQVPVRELREATLKRQLLSRRQLFERMVEFWTDHFNIDIADGQCQRLKTADDRDVIRKHALGNFGDLLRGSAHSAAMLFYLDNYTNVVGAPQENYSRELMELHTLGVTGPYTEFDVLEVARCLTGWAYSGAQQPDHGTFLFRSGRHDNGAKTVLGTPIPAGGGQQDGETVLDMLASHPSTIDFVSRKLAKYLLTYEPPEAVVTLAKNAWVNTGGDIKAIVATILQRESLEHSKLSAAPKIKRPQHFAIGLLRALQIRPTSYNRIVSELAILGQVPFAWPAPNGYPDSLGAWGTSVLPRWDFASKLLNNEINPARPDWPALGALLGGLTQNNLVEKLSLLLTGGTLRPEERAKVDSFVDSSPIFNLQLVRDAAFLIASAPSYQMF